MNKRIRKKHQQYGAVHGARRKVRLLKRAMNKLFMSTDLKPGLTALAKAVVAAHKDSSDDVYEWATELTKDLCKAND